MKLDLSEPRLINIGRKKHTTERAACRYDDYDDDDRRSELLFGDSEDGNRICRVDDDVYTYII